MRFTCANEKCGWSGDETEVREVREYHGMPGPFCEVFYYCPRCGQDVFEGDNDEPELES